jgi:hypothetical protein
MTSLCRKRVEHLWRAFHAPKLSGRYTRTHAAWPPRTLVRGRIGGIPEPHIVFRDVLAGRVALILVYHR